MTGGGGIAKVYGTAIEPQARHYNFGGNGNSVTTKFFEENHTFRRS